MCVWVQYFSWSPYSHPVMTAQLISSQKCMAGYNILAGHHTAVQSWQLSAHLLTAMCGWIQYFSWSLYSHPVITAQLICLQQCVAGYNILAGHHLAIQSGQLWSATHSQQYMAGNNILVGHHTAIQSWQLSSSTHSQQCVAGYNILVGHHTAIPSWQLSSSTHSQQCVAGYNILAGHHTAIHSWQFSYLLTAMCCWVQYFSWSPSSHPVMTAQLICSKQCVAGYNILAGHHSAIQSWQLNSLLTSMCGWVQYFSWSPYSHPVMTAQLSAYSNVWLGTIF